MQKPYKGKYSKKFEGPSFFYSHYFKGSHFYFSTVTRNCKNSECKKIKKGPLKIVTKK